MNELYSVLEGLLFIVGEDGLSLEEISEVLDCSESEAKALVESLTLEYNNNSSRGITIGFLGGKYKLITKEVNIEYYKKLAINTNNFLSQASLETLVIIAYNGPITRLKVDEIRGINSSQIIRKLTSMGLIKNVGKSDLPGKPNLYEVTSDFLDYFGLSSLEDLPKCDFEAEVDHEKELFTSKYTEEILN